MRPARPARLLRGRIRFCCCWRSQLNARTLGGRTVVFRTYFGGATILGLLLCCSCSRVARGTSPPPLRAPRPGTICAGELAIKKAASGAGSRVTDRRQPKSIQETVRSRYGQLRTCYEDALWRNAEARGQVSMRFVISASGRVESACVEQPALADGEMLECLRAEFLVLNFGTGQPLTTVVYPILFEPGASSRMLR
jgi:hypothetical protein